MRKWITTLIMFFLIVFAFVFLGRFERQSSEADVNKIKDAIEHAAITCYALEGSYPPIEYLEKNYGIVLNHRKYFYFYEMNGSNIMPIIKVIKR